MTCNTNKTSANWNIQTIVNTDNPKKTKIINKHCTKYHTKNITQIQKNNEYKHMCNNKKQHKTNSANNTPQGT